MLSLLPLLAFVPAIFASPIIARDERPKYIPGKYLVQVKPDVDASTLLSHHDTVRRLTRRNADHDPVERTFSIGTLNAYLGDFDEASIPDVSALDEVLSIVQDEYIYLEKTDFAPLSRRALTTQNPSIWSLGDLSHKATN